MRAIAVVLLCGLTFAGDDNLLRSLLGADDAERAAAAARVRALEPKAREAIAGQLAGLLKHEDVLRRREAARGLEQLGPQARVAVHALVAALRDRDTSVRIRALGALSEMKDDSEATVKGVLEATTDPDSTVRAAGVAALWNIGGAQKPVLEALIDSLNDSSASIRWRAAIALGRREKDAGPAVIALATALRDEDPSVRQAAVDALQRLGEVAKPAWRHLIGQLDAEDTKFVLDVAAVLGAISVSPDLVVPMIKRHLTDKDWRIRSKACWALSKLGTHAKLALKELELATKDKNPAVRRTALQAIYAADPKRPGAYDAYTKAYDEEQKWRTLRHYNNDLTAAIKSLTRLLKTGSALTRSVAADDLGDLGRDARPAISALIAALQDPENKVRGSVLRALAEIRIFDPAPILPLMKDPDSEIREEAVRAVGKSELLDCAALDAIVARLIDSVADVRTEARWALEDLKGAAVPALIRGLADERELGIRIAKFAGRRSRHSPTSDRRPFRTLLPRCA